MSGARRDPLPRPMAAWPEFAVPTPRPPGSAATESSGLYRMREREKTRRALSEMQRDMDRLFEGDCGGDDR